ncbi:single-stranded DNA-binding protein [bacterium]|nr:single-stranded DNA-binding protein [bacterium]
MLNRVVLVGRLTKDPEIRYTQSNVPVVSFTIAVNRQFANSATGEKDTDFIPIIVWRKQAENVKNYTHKGSLVAVDGRIQTRTYDDNNGVRKYVTEVVADNVSFLEPKGAQDGQMASEPQQSNQQNEEDDKYANVVFSNNDLPF